MANHFSDLGDRIEVPFDSVFIDPNNPRISPDRSSRYEDPDDIFDAELQQQLTVKAYTVYPADDLEDAIVEQGWIPIDPIIVWEHPDRKEHYIVVEGNTRTSVLRRIRQVRIDREKVKLEKFKNSKRTPSNELERQQGTVDQLEAIISATNNLGVYPVKAHTIEELEKILPRILGVRHIKHAQQWSPYATNLYIFSLYERLFCLKYGPDADLNIDDDLVREVGAKVSLGDTKTRRNIQSASAFDHFKRHYEDKLPDGEAFDDGDQYFFEQILQNGYTQDKFGFTRDRLILPDESEKALFTWAFSKPRKKQKTNPNVFHKAENMRDWANMSKYDAENGTGFANLFDVNEPEQATKTMREVMADYSVHRIRKTPVNTLQSLLESLKEIKGETMITQAEYLEGTLEEIASLVEHYLKMIKADRE